MTASVPVGLESLRDRVNDYRDQLASLDRAMAALRDCADNLLAAIEHDCLALQSLPPQSAGDTAGEPAATASLQRDDRADEACEFHGICAAEPASDLTPATTVSAIPLPTVGTTCPDDFTLIKGVDRATADVLVGLGLESFAELAGFYPEDVAEIGAVLADNRRISRECWIEQAAILAAGHTTEYVRQMARAAAVPLVASPSTTPASEAARPRWVPCFTPLQGDILPANGLEIASPPPSAPIDIKAQLAEARAAAGISRRASGARRPPKLADARQRARQQALADHRSSRVGWRLALTTAAALSLAVVSGSFMASSELHSDLATRLTRLGMCTAESISTNHDCAVLAWLLL